MYCLNCNNETSNPKFCDRKCSAVYNNKMFPKRHKESNCISCGIAVSTKRKYCRACKKQHSIDMTIDEATYNRHHKSSAFALVRTRARAVAKKLNWNKCSNCGYDKHIEIAHIKPISSYPSTTLISVVNEPSNLLALCPNCHWEHDNLQAPQEGVEPT